jgi:DNA repair protein RecN (Recombination protein N)
MIVELNIENFAVIENISLKFDSGMTVLSGDEGTGKSLIVDALGILLGTRAPAKLIRSGKESARVEGIFSLSKEVNKNLSNLLKENDIEPENDGTLVVSRDIHQNGRSVARINGRAVTQSLLRSAGENLVDIHGQLDYVSVLDVHHQLDLLDAFGNLTELKNIYRKLVDQLRQKRKELETFDVTRSEGKLELLKYQVDEIKSADIKVREESELQNRFDLLQHSELVKDSCLNAFNYLYDDDRSVTSLIHNALSELKRHKSFDSTFKTQREQLEVCLCSIDDVANELRNYGENVDLDVEELGQIEQRLNLLNSLKRKYGPTLDDVLNFYNKTVNELDCIENSQEHKKQLVEELKKLEHDCAKNAVSLSHLRNKSAASLLKIVNTELADIGLDLAKFDISLFREEDSAGLPVDEGKKYSFTREGIDHIEFMMATNPGEPVRPLRTIVSGGETSRIMLALKSALKKVDPIPTLVFDEIDAGIGGRSGDSIGKKLSSLAHQQQVICITHLPQIACFGDAHIKLTKDVKSGRASTSVESVKGQNRVEEIAAMLGAKNAGKTMYKGAETLMDNAILWKNKVAVVS